MMSKHNQNTSYSSVFSVWYKCRKDLEMLNRSLILFTSGNKLIQEQQCQGIKHLYQLLSTVKTIICNIKHEGWITLLQEILQTTCSHFFQIIITAAARKWDMVQEVEDSLEDYLKLVYELLGYKCDGVIYSVLSAAVTITEEAEFGSPIQLHIFGAVIRKVLKTYLNPTTSTESLMWCVLLAKLWLVNCPPENLPSIKKILTQLLPCRVYYTSDKDLNEMQQPISMRKLLQYPEWKLAQMVSQRGGEDTTHSLMEFSCVEAKDEVMLIHHLTTLHNILLPCIQVLKHILLPPDKTQGTVGQENNTFPGKEEFIVNKKDGVVSNKDLELPSSSELYPENDLIISGHYKDRKTSKTTQHNNITSNHIVKNVQIKRRITNMKVEKCTVLKKPKWKSKILKKRNRLQRNFKKLRNKNINFSFGSFSVSNWEVSDLNNMITVESHINGSHSQNRHEQINRKERGNNTRKERGNNTSKERIISNDFNLSGEKCNMSSTCDFGVIGMNSLENIKESPGKNVTRSGKHSRCEKYQRTIEKDAQRQQRKVPFENYGCRKTDKHVSKCSPCKEEGWYYKTKVHNEVDNNSSVPSELLIKTDKCLKNENPLFTPSATNKEWKLMPFSGDSAESTCCHSLQAIHTEEQPRRKDIIFKHENNALDHPSYFPWANNTSTVNSNELRSITSSGIGLEEKYPVCDEEKVCELELSKTLKEMKDVECTNTRKISNEDNDLFGYVVYKEEKYNNILQNIEEYTTPLDIITYTNDTTCTTPTQTKHSTRNSNREIRSLAADLDRENNRLTVKLPVVPQEYKEGITLIKLHYYGINLETKKKFSCEDPCVYKLLYDADSFTNLKKDDDNAHTNYIQSIYKKKLNSPVSPLEDDVNDNHMIKLCSPIMKKKLDSPVSPEPEDVNDIEMINKCHPTDNKKLHNPTSSQPQNVNDIEMINFCDDDDLDISKDSLMAFLSSEDMSLIDSKGSLFSDM